MLSAQDQCVNRNYKLKETHDLAKYNNSFHSGVSRDWTDLADAANLAQDLFLNGMRNILIVQKHKNI